MVNYLVLGNDGLIGGYERADILLCDLAEHSKRSDAPLAIWRRTESLQIRYAPSSEIEVRADMEADYRAENICKECGGRNGHATPFCSVVDLSEAIAS